jgi:hypothetical protein
MCRLAGSLERTAARRAAIRKDRLEVAACWATLRGTARRRRLRLVTGDARFHQSEVAARLLEDAADDEGRRAVSPQEARRLGPLLLTRKASLYFRRVWRRPLVLEG